MTSSDRITDPVIRQVRQVPQGVEIDMSLPAELFFFRGHFPERPILPGVVQVDWAVRFADRYLKTDITSARDFRVKFKSVIEPTEVITMVLLRSSNDRKLEFSFRNHTGELSQGSITLADNA